VRSTITLIVALTLLVSVCGYGNVGTAGNIPEAPEDTIAAETLKDLLTTQVSDEGEPSEPKITLTDTVNEAGSPTDEALETDERVDDLIAELAATIESGGDLGPLVSEGGMYLVYNSEPILYSQEDLNGILTYETTRQWPSHLISADDPAAADLPYRTFADEIGESFLDAFHDPDNQFLRKEWRDLDEKGIPEEANPIPVELREFDTVSIVESGQDAIEWFVWYVSIDFEDGQPLIVGLTFRGWTP
jgi:hypothetical protein